MKRIGEILIANGWIEPAILQRALAKQAASGHRLCSLLVLGGAVGADEAACALGEQHGVAAALQRHLTHRDPSLAPLLSAALARACVALPIGRMGNGDVIVCVRDPSPALEVQLGRAMNEPVRLAVAPAHQLEELVLETYGPDDDDANEFDVDLSTGPIMSLELEEEPKDPLSDEALAGLGSLELVDLDDTGVSKDESQTQVQIGNQRHSTRPPTNVSVDAPTYRAGTAPIGDAPTYRSSTAIIVDAPSQREPPGRAALSAAGIAIPRTQTPRAADDASGIAVARTRTPPRETVDDEGIAIPRTQTPGRGATDDQPAVSRARTPERSLASAAASAMESVAAAESAAAAAAFAAASAALAELVTDDEPQAAPVPLAKPEAAAASFASASSALAELVTDDVEPQIPAPRASTPVVSPPVTAPRDSAPALRPVTPLPSIAPPRTDGVRPPPAALAALQRASSAASRMPNIPPRPIPSALPPRPVAPQAVAPTPDEIAIGTQLPTAQLAVSPRLAEALSALTAATTIDAACDALMAFAAKRWSAALLLDIEGASATGRRGHGAQVSDDLAQWIVMSLEEPSLLQAAFAFGEIAISTPGGHGDVEDRLQKLLGLPRAPSAVVVSVDGKPFMMLAVGDPDGDDVKTAAADLQRLIDGAGGALTRLRR